jgi:hypothetical protein
MLSLRLQVSLWVPAAPTTRRIVPFTIGEQAGIGGNGRAMATQYENCRRSSFIHNE